MHWPDYPAVKQDIVLFLVIYNTAYCLGDRLGDFMFVLINVLVRKQLRIEINGNLFRHDLGCRNRSKIFHRFLVGHKNNNILILHSKNIL
jgi:hypothetical protein